MENEVLETLRSRRFPTVQILFNPGDGAPATALDHSGYFNAAELDELLENYRPAMRTAKMMILVPQG